MAVQPVPSTNTRSALPDVVRSEWLSYSGEAVLLASQHPRWQDPTAALLVIGMDPTRGTGFASPAASPSAVDWFRLLLVVWSYCTPLTRLRASYGPHDSSPAVLTSRTEQPDSRQRTVSG